MSEAIDPVDNVISAPVTQFPLTTEIGSSSIYVDHTNNPWEFGWNGVFSALLILFTLVIACRQRKLQKQISNSQSDLQKQIAEDQHKLLKQIADRDVRLQNYQHRIKCYHQIMEAYYILMSTNFRNTINLLENKNVPTEMLKEISRGNNLMMKSGLESRMLFSSELVGLIVKIQNDYQNLYNIGFSIATQNQPKIEKTRQFAINNGIDTFDKLVTIIANPANIDPEIAKELKSLVPELATISELENSLKLQFESAGLHELFRKETQVD